MSDSRKIRRALLSVYDKTGLVEFARALHDEFGIELISTGGTAKVLRDAGLPVTLVETITGFPEMLDGRVKTLHPKIHAAILADRDNPEHMRQLAEQGIEPIDMVVVNLYPFEKTIAKPDCTFEEAIEMIDIGGPCLLRAAGKNQKHILVAPDPDKYCFVEMALKQWHDAAARAECLRSFAWSAFKITTLYDAQISNWLAKTTEHGRPLNRLMALFSWGELRYGENPHQASELLNLERGGGQLDLTTADCCADQDDAQRRFSFNNFLDANAALELCAELTRAAHGRTAQLRFAAAQPDDAATGTGAGRQCFAPLTQDVATRRRLPHGQVPGATYWVTFRSVIGPLSDTERGIAFDALRHWNGQRLDLHAAVVMADHAHALLTPREMPDQPGAYFNLAGLLKSIKSFSGREISQRRGGGAQVWDTESYDHWIRDRAEFEQKWSYICSNPVKEGLAPTPDRYRWWCAVDYLGLGIGMPVSSDTPIPPVLDEGTSRGVEFCTLANERKAELYDTGERKAELCDTGERKAELYDTGERKAELCDTGPVVCFVKHTNACGAAVHPDPLEAYRHAYLGDPNAAMGGVLAVNFNVDAAFAEAVMDTYARWGKSAGAGGFFLEVWLAPSFTDEAVQVIRTKKEWGQRVRLLAVGDMSALPDPNEMDFKRIAGGMLMQTRDLVGLDEDQWKVVTQRSPTDSELDDLRLAWLVCKHTKSNAITICRDGMLIGNGAGQMSRVMSCRIATWLAQENGHAEALKGAVAASDAFFPFRDGPGLLVDAGVTALIQPGGSKRDAEVIEACNARGVAMIFTGTRHFKH